jgi:hypothetical protein
MTTELQPPRHIEVIAAFADGERVVTDELREALTTAEGREYLIDLVATRELVQLPTHQPAVAPSVAARPGTTRTWLAIAAMLGAVLFAGYQVGRRVAQSEARRAPIVAPAPDRVIPFTWDESKRGD